jgi:pimeloyl-ACP methyl ester carboxylesterase
VPAFPDLHHSYGLADQGVDRDYVAVTASDGRETTGVLHRAGRGGRTALLVIHPRGDFSRHYLAPYLARGGYPVLCQTSRYLNNDIDALQERTLLDVAAALRALRGLGYEDILLIGNSGGGALTSLYQREATRSPGDRIDSAAAGFYRVPLAREDMPAAAGLIQVAAHIGEGHFMQKVIDPAVVDESRPELTDPSLDMYDPANGYAHPPQTSSFDPEWLQTFRQAQAARCRRIDQLALAQLRRQAGGRSARTDADDQDARRRAVTVPYLTVYRTLADPGFVDLTIEPSDRVLGSVFAPADPFLGNYGRGGVGRVMTARGWLSTWSAAYTHADMRACLPEFDCPSLFVSATADTEVRPPEFDEIVAASAATDKTVELVTADHYFRDPLTLDPRPQAALAELLLDWLGRRFRS